MRVQRAAWPDHLGRVDLHAEVPTDHDVRSPPSFDLRGLYADVRARGEISGAPATDPKILLGAVGLRHQ